MDEDGRPHVVPITFALDGDTIVSAVDAKPKRSRELKRLRNIAANPNVSLLIDHYDDDWSTLWWCRLDGRARVVHEGAELAEALRALAAKYPQYRERPPDGPVIIVEIANGIGWSAS